MAHLLASSRRRRSSDRSEMEIASGLENHRWVAMAHPAEDERPGRHPNLRLPGRSFSHAAVASAGRDQRFGCPTGGRGQLVGLRKNLYPRQCQFAARTAKIDNQRTGQCGTVCALPSFVATRMARSERGDVKMEPIGFRSAPESDERNAKQFSGA